MTKHRFNVSSYPQSRAAEDDETEQGDTEQDDSEQNDSEQNDSEQDDSEQVGGEEEVAYEGSYRERPEHCGPWVVNI